ncbi:hypothetical protein A3860_14710 [Niastella vici]|uniref:Uncharacterized protein n=1 Tax=Niastella vici TaxID=1703345 RepID=A0A1V9G5K9_9BACT|nr:hypothetical protein [Niastella vici]OQP65842.1 hypothetical protein A3860_14710 [Niastella vici]
MSIHIGQIIQAEVESKKLTQKAFGALIHKHEKTVPDIYERTTMSIDLLITISAVLNKDFLSVFYNEEPMNRLRTDEIAKLNLQIQRVTEENNRLQKELDLSKNLVETQKELISFVKDQLAQFKF